MRVCLSPGLRIEMLRHAQQWLPQEACGLLGGEPEADRLSFFVGLRNRAEGADQFVMDPVEVARAQAQLRRRGLRLLATFHSHPGAVARPSQADRQGAWPELLHLIMSIDADGQPGELTAWRFQAADDQAAQLQIHPDA